MNLQDLKVTRKTVAKSARRVDDNDVIAGFYRQLFTDTARETLVNRAESVEGCFKLWSVDHYRRQKVKDIKRINLCKDKFCMNCQNVLSKQRYAKYKPVLDELLRDKDIYHIVFTVPNCDGSELVGTLDRMYKKFPYIIRYFQGERKCRGVDFAGYGFTGAVRSLEITTKLTGNRTVEYHPHFHCLFVLRKGIDCKRKHVNDFSYHRNPQTGAVRLRRKYTDLEVLLQKSWYLFYNDERLTAESLAALDQGYSVTADLAKGNYKEVFKYAVKGDTKNDSMTDVIFNYDVFETLYNALHRRKVMQGYGVLNRYDFETVTGEEVEKVYEEIRAILREVEQPEEQLLRLEEVFADLEHDDITYISKSAIRQYLNDSD